MSLEYFCKSISKSSTLWSEHQNRVENTPSYMLLKVAEKSVGSEVLL